MSIRKAKLEEFQSCLENCRKLIKMWCIGVFTTIFAICIGLGVGMTLASRNSDNDSKSLLFSFGLLALFGVLFIVLTIVEWIKAYFAYDSIRNLEQRVSDWEIKSKLDSSRKLIIGVVVFSILGFLPMVWIGKLVCQIVFWMNYKKLREISTIVDTE